MYRCIIWTTAFAFLIILGLPLKMGELLQKFNYIVLLSDFKIHLIAFAFPRRSMRRSSVGRWNGHIYSVRLIYCYDYSFASAYISIIANEGKSTLELGVWFCQLILHRTAMRLHSESEQLISETCNNARLIITKSLQTRFSAAPGLIDNVYYVLGYAALTLCDYSPSDPLIDQVRAFLLHLAPSSDHLAYRIACIIGEVQRRYSEAATAEQPSPNASNALFVTTQAPRTENIDIGQLIPTGGTMDGIIDGYACYDQLMATGYVPPQQAFSAPAVFQHPAPVTGGAMPISLVPRALHDF